MILEKETMNNYEKLINKLEQENKSHKIPGSTLDELMLAYLKQFSQRYDHDHQLLLVGAHLSDIRLEEAFDKGAPEEHIAMALDYATQIYVEFEIPKTDQEIINEIITTHHGGTQKTIEAQIFKNADNFKFLDPKGCMHLFTSLYFTEGESFETAMNMTIEKLEEKLGLTDLDATIMTKAVELFDLDMLILDNFSLIATKTK